MDKVKYMYEKLSFHIGHSIEIVGYGKSTFEPYATIKDYENVSIECLDCNEVLIDYENNEP